MATQNRAPTSDEAASGTWSGAAGSRWQLVDDYPSTSSADALTGGTAAAAITFGFSAFAIPAGSTGISVQVRYADGEAANGANNCGGRLKVGGSYFNAATHNPSGTAGTLREDSWATNPKTGAAWTVDDINGIGANALQAFGINSTDSNPTFFVASVELQVTYSPPVSGSLSQTLEGAAAAGEADVVITGGAAATLEASSIAADGDVEVHAQAGVELDAATVAGAGTAGSSDVEGQVVQTLGGAGLSSMAMVEVRAIASVGLDDAGVAASAQVPVVATAAPVLADATVVAEADVPAAGQLAVQLEAAAIAGEADVRIAGQAAIAAADATVAATAAALPAVQAIASVQLDEASVAATGTVSDQGGPAEPCHLGGSGGGLRIGMRRRRPFIRRES